MTLLLAFAMFFSAAMPTGDEPVIGGRCEGCEIVFSGIPRELSWQARIAPKREPGEPLVIEGTVRKPDGKPAAGIVVYAYHTDAAGEYPRGSTRHGRLRGWARTNAEGHYRFDTIRPASYPRSRNPQHVHMHVIEPGKATYYIDDIVFTDDPLLDVSHHRRRAPRGGDGVVTPAKNRNGWHARRDIVLRLNIGD